MLAKVITASGRTVQHCNPVAAYDTKQKRWGFPLWPTLMHSESITNLARYDGLTSKPNPLLDGGHVPSVVQAPMRRVHKNQINYENIRERDLGGYTQNCIHVRRD